MAYALERPACGEDWQAFHDIREQVLWSSRGRSGYNRQHADDYAVPDNHPMLLKLQGRPIGTVRLDDFGDGTGCVRLVAIIAEEQGKGHGRIMSELLEAKARDRGIGTLFVNAAPEAVAFYERTGWSRYEWDRAELVGIAADCVQMRKLLV